MENKMSWNRPMQIQSTGTWQKGTKGIQWRKNNLLMMLQQLVIHMQKKKKKKNLDTDALYLNKY